jgi:hypothetical protein
VDGLWEVGRCGRSEAAHGRKCTVGTRLFGDVLGWISSVFGAAKPQKLVGGRHILARAEQRQCRDPELGPVARNGRAQSRGWGWGRVPGICRRRHGGEIHPLGPRQRPAGRLGMGRHFRLDGWMTLSLALVKKAQRPGGVDGRIWLIYCFCAITNGCHLWLSIWLIIPSGEWLIPANWPQRKPAFPTNGHPKWLWRFPVCLTGPQFPTFRHTKKRHQKPFLKKILCQEVARDFSLPFLNSISVG